MLEPLPYDIIAAPEDEPLILAGPPGKLIGRVELHNPGNVNVVLRDAGLNDPSGRLLSQPLRYALPTLVLRPDQGRTVPLTVAVDPTAPPGEYRVELDLAGRSRPALLHVTELFDLSVRPRSLVVTNKPGQAQRKRLIVTNLGNVPFTIGDIGEVDLMDDMLLDRAVRIAVEPWVRRADVNVEELVVAVLGAAREEAYRAGSLVVGNAGGQIEVKPGKTTSINIGRILPKGWSQSPSSPLRRCGLPGFPTMFLACPAT